MEGNSENDNNVIAGNYLISAPIGTPPSCVSASIDALHAQAVDGDTAVADIVMQNAHPAETTSTNSAEQSLSDTVMPICSASTADLASSLSMVSAAPSTMASPSESSRTSSCPSPITTANTLGAIRKRKHADTTCTPPPPSKQLKKSIHTISNHVNKIVHHANQTISSLPGYESYPVTHQSDSFHHGNQTSNGHMQPLTNINTGGRTSNGGKVYTELWQRYILQHNEVKYNLWQSCLKCPGIISN
jgi:hypothetical protein